MNSDPFDILSVIKILSDGAGSRQFKEVLSSMYVLALAVGTIGIALSLILCGLKLAASKNGSSRDEAKKEFFWKAVLGIVLFSFTSILGAVYGIAQTFK